MMLTGEGLTVCYTRDGEAALSEVSLGLEAGELLAVVGPNGSGKTTLLRLLRGEIEPTSGEIRRAEPLRIVYFDQNRALDTDLTLRRALCPHGDSVVYQDREIHVASWAARFLFSGDDLNQPVGRLSGGERARILIAQLMLQPAEVLLLDEPTNDLDIPTLEVLEESLLEYSGALVLVTHDRYMLERISTIVLGLDGLGGAESFGDYQQWDLWQQAQQAKGTSKPPTAGRHTPEVADAPQPAIARKKLSYLEAREFAVIEKRILAAEQELHDARMALADPAIASDAPRLQSTCVRLDEAQKAVDRLYERWAELEGKGARNGLRTD